MSEGSATLTIVVSMLMANAARQTAARIFRDNVQSYSTVEPAIDLTASSPLALAWQISPPRPL
jgi:hypothetical protein